MTSCFDCLYHALFALGRRAGRSSDIMKSDPFGDRYPAIQSEFPYFFFIGVGLSPLGTAATSGLLHKPQMIDEGDCEAIGGMKIGRENRSTRRKPAPAPLWSPQVPHDQTQARTRAASVGNQRLTAWAMARPVVIYIQRILLLHIIRVPFQWSVLDNALRVVKLLKRSGLIREISECICGMFAMFVVTEVTYVSLTCGKFKRAF
jgi:hypothetical protein